MDGLYIGVISGTSMDAIDVALVEFSNNQPKFIAANSYPLQKKYSKLCKIMAVSESCSLKEFGELDHQAGIIFADAINDFIAEQKLKPEHIIAIGSHGQTIKHHPDLKYRFTLQIGDPNIISYKTKIRVVADFRRKDMIAGGQGAPLAPILHQELFSTEKENRVILNIGGIANITTLPKDKNVPVKGYDTGPGNCLLDAWCKSYFNKDYDEEGNLAKSGTLQLNILEKLLQEKYFKEPTPKSTGTEFFNLNWVKSILSKELLDTFSRTKEQNINLLTTLTHLSAKTIADCINNEKLDSGKIYVCGGGAYNKFLLELISEYCDLKLSTTEELNLNPGWVEATLFAVLAKKRLNNESLDLKTITGSKDKIILGGIY